MFSTSLRKAYLFFLFIGLTGCTRCDNQATPTTVVPANEQPANTTTDGTMATPIPDATAPVTDAQTPVPTVSPSPTNDLTPAIPQ